MNGGSSQEKTRRILLIGPLPPPYGGARVSFAEFLRYVRANWPGHVRFIKMPILKKHILPGRSPVSPVQTARMLAKALTMMARVDGVILFASRNFCFSYGILIAMMAKAFRKRCVFRLFGGRPGLALRRWPKPIANLLCTLLSLADKLVVQANVGKADFPGSLQNRIGVVRGYRDMAEIPKRAGRPAKVVRFVYVGQVVRMKGIRVLLQAFRELQEVDLPRPVELHVYGKGPPGEVSRVERTPSAYYHGHVPNNVVIKDLRGYEVCVLPTLWEKEGHPGSLIEAMMAGLPIITTRWPGPSEIVEHGQNGLLVEPGSVSSLKEAMLRLVQNDRYRQSLAEGAKEMGRRFDSAQVLPDLMQALGIG